MSRKENTAYILPKVLLKSKRRLKWCILSFCLVISLPGAYLLYEANGRLETETFFIYHSAAQELAGRIDRSIHKILRLEAGRPTEHYSYIESFPAQGGPLKLSPLAQHPKDLSIPGLVGYFQLDSSGKLHCPHLPEMTPMTANRAKELGLTYEDLKERFQVLENIQSLLKRNRLLGKRRSNLEGLPGYSAKSSRRNRLSSRNKKIGLLRKFRSEFSIRYKVSENENRASLMKSLWENTESDTGSAMVAPAAQGLSMVSHDVGVMNEIVGLGSVEVREEDGADSGEFPKDEDSSELKNIKASKRNALKSFESGLESQAEAFELSEEEYRQRYDTDLSGNDSPSAELAERNKIERTKKIDFDESRLDKSYLARNQEYRKNKTALQSLAFSASINPFQLSMLGTGHFIAYRNAVVAGEPVIQGMILKSEDFLKKTIEEEFKSSRIWDIGNLLVGFKGNYLKSYGATEPAGTKSGFLLSRDKLSAPFQDLELIFSLVSIPDSSGSRMMRYVSVGLVIFFIAGLLVIYRLGVQQIYLMNQQQDFVSAVSHELKTPLTSIRMYGEMLQKGWGDEEKKKGYYDFITKESERLSRLIGNVLQLSKINRSEIEVNLKQMDRKSIKKLIEERVRKPLDNSEFEFVYEVDDSENEKQIRVDEDHLTQILINLVDNGIKFSKASPLKKIVFALQERSSDELCISVRDFGPGIPEDHLKSIFKLFYRGENELTRTTKGTGIGLALVYELSKSMGARLEVENKGPGVEFRVIFPA